MLGQLGRVVVQEVAESVHGLGDGGCKERVVLWEFLGQGDQRSQCSCLYGRSSANLVIWERGCTPTLKDGMESWARLDEDLELEPVSLEDSSSKRPSASPDSGAEMSQVLWSDGIVHYSGPRGDEDELDGEEL